MGSWFSCLLLFQRPLELEVATLERRESSDHGTFGVVHVGPLRLFSGELPWRDNQKSISCIPTGEYECLWTYSPRFRRFMYVVTNVTGRDGIRFHVANFMGDASKGLLCQLNGCIALGEKLGSMGGQKGVFLSTPAIRRFEQYLDKEPFKLVITNA